MQPPMSPPRDAAEFQMSRGFILLMAFTCGAAVANLYYNQPMLGLIARSFGTDAAGIAAVPTATQLGYAAGLLLLGPLGDRYDRRRVILCMAFALAATLFATAAAPSAAWLAACSFAMGMSATLVQQVIPLVAHLAPEHLRGRTVGTVMSGLLLGILCGRFVAGVVGESFGWRVMFAGSGVLAAALGLVLSRALPHLQAHAHGGYAALLRSTLAQAARHATLREAALGGALLFGAFSAFWVSLTPLLESAAFRLDARIAGVFGLIGAAGALMAPLAGRWTDRRGPLAVLGGAIAAVAVSFVMFYFSGRSLAGLIAGTLLMDLGIQAALIANQARLFALDAQARSRINAFFMTAYFLGGALGAWCASQAWGRGGWHAAMAVGLAFSLGAGLVRLLASLRGDAKRAPVDP
jgi:predicted MFS family arabinose efflux permease